MAIGETRLNEARGDREDLTYEKEGGAMERNPVKSSNIKSVGYDSRTKVMEIEYNNGGVYEYHGFLPDHHAKLMAADSIGGHVANHVRGKFETKKKPKRSRI